MKKFRAMTAALVVVLVLGVAGSGFLGFQLYDSMQENALLSDQMNVQTASMQAEIDALNGELSALSVSGGDKDARIKDLESQVETLEAQVQTLESQLAAKSTVSPHRREVSPQRLPVFKGIQNPNRACNRKGAWLHRLLPLLLTRPRWDRAPARSRFFIPLLPASRCDTIRSPGRNLSRVH